MKRFVVWWNPSTRTLGGLGWRIFGEYETRAEAEASIARERKLDKYAEWEIRAEPDEDIGGKIGGPSLA